MRNAKEQETKYLVNEVSQRVGLSQKQIREDVCQRCPIYLNHGKEKKPLLEKE